MATRVTSDDAMVLRFAAKILRNRSRKPNGFWLKVICKLLTDTADTIDLEAEWVASMTTHDFREDAPI